MSGNTTAPPAASSSSSSTIVDDSEKQDKKRMKFSDINEGDFLCEIQYYKVTDKDDQKIQVKNERGFEFGINNKIIEEGLYSANQFTITKKVNKTELVRVFENAKDTIFTINFNKQPSEETVQEILDKTLISDFTDAGKRKKLAQHLMHGKERTLIGYLQDGETTLGRSQVVDLEEHFKALEKGKNASEAIRSSKRLVDHRTINWIILKNVKFILK